MADTIKITVETDNELKQTDCFAIEDAVKDALGNLRLDLTVLSVKVFIQ